MPAISTVEASSTTEDNNKHLNLVKQRMGVATLNMRTGHQLSGGDLKLAVLARELGERGFGLLGMSELRYKGSPQDAVELLGSGDSQGGGCWSMIWSGSKEKHERGVGLLMDHAWTSALIAWGPVNDRLMWARFVGDRGQSVTIIVGYSPTEAGCSTEAECFYDTLAAQAQNANQRKDIVIMLGDFNAAVGKDCSSGCIGKYQPESEPITASANGERLIRVAAMNNLKVANTFFQHRPHHQYTHVSNRASACSRRCRVKVKRLLSVKDYITISARHMSSVQDCRAYRGFTWDTDHVLVGMYMRLSLRAPQKQGAAHRDFDTTLLDRFCIQLQNRFALLGDTEPTGASSQQEYSNMAEALTEAARDCLKPNRGGGKVKRRGQFVLSQNTLKLLEARRKAHKVWLGSRSDAARRTRNKVSKQADRAVQLDLQRHTDLQAKEAQTLLMQRNLRGFMEATKRMAGHQKAKQSFPAMRDATGSMQYGPAQVMSIMTAHFNGLLGGATELSHEICNQMEADIFNFELQHKGGGDVMQPGGECPTLEEVTKCIAALRTHATPGEDQIDARMLKAGSVVCQWLHRVIVAVWESGKVPDDWKSAIIVALYKGKGPKDTAGNYRGISLLSIAGKVYATILARRLYKQTDEKLHEAQCGFRGGRGTVDAIFALRSLSQACSERRKCMARAYIDFTKAYDSINRHALWRALRLYGVHPKLIELLEDLHTDTFAAIRLGGKIGPRFKVLSGVRQGCVIAPTLFNIFIDLVMRKAISRMPGGCGVKIQTRAEGGAGVGSFEYIVMLMYADDVVLMSHDPAELANMLRVVDVVASEFGMLINASKTEIQIHNFEGDLPPFNISTGSVTMANDFKYLGSWVQNDGSMDKEINVRRGRALGIFHSYEKVWAHKKLPVASKMAIYNSIVLPHLLYGCETWNCSAAQLVSIESVHSSCLRHILGVELHARHSLKHIRHVCGSQPVSIMIAKRTFQWLGHVCRMQGSRLPKMAYCCVVEGPRSRGRPKGFFRHTYCELLKLTGETQPLVWLDKMFDCSQDRNKWRSMVHNFELREAPKLIPTRRSERIRNLK